MVHAVTFNYRGNPLVQQARHAIARGDIGTPHFVHGHYLQDWLLKDTDYSWRLEPDKGGASSALGDIGSHWCDLAQHVTGLRITQVLGDITTVVPKRKKPTRLARGLRGGRRRTSVELVDIKVEDLASVLLRFDNGAQRQLLGRSGLRRAQERSRPRGLRLEGVDRDGARSIRTSSGSATATSANEILQKDPALLDADGRAATRTCRAATRRPGPTRSAT